MGATKLSLVKKVHLCAHCELPIVRACEAAAARAKYCGRPCYSQAKRRVIRDQVVSGRFTCRRCKVEKALGEFSPSGHRGRELCAWCKTCKAEIETARRKRPAVVAKFHARYETDMDFRARELLRAVGKRCRKDGVDLDLDREWLAARLNAGKCELTGLAFDMSVSKRRPTARTPSIDRISANGGYTKANCRVILYAVNTALSNYGLAAFLPIAAALVSKCQLANQRSQNR